MSAFANRAFFAASQKLAEQWRRPKGAADDRPVSKAEEEDRHTLRDLANRKTRKSEDKSRG